ncbi:hypothetical protein [Pedobacter sp. MR22-3]|uniref:hypothetical protein n=1 Tax=Pedobacter sp. MR22-3 TaxID=2994552 RepID=UPI0022464303|nr:hypothetical protein [Pedobacter sp. MR22-3]MCX2585933.1 hypothetical protein [Pedobacter sp. MR22-3]
MEQKEDIRSLIILKNLDSQLLQRMITTIGLARATNIYMAFELLSNNQTLWMQNLYLF